MKKDNLVCSNIIEKVACKAAFLILFIFFCEIWALAQETPRLPSGQEPGAQAERYKYDSERAKKYLEYKTPKAPKIEIEKEKVRPEIEGPSFILKEVNVTGSTEFKRQDFEFIYKPYIGKSVTFTDIETIANMIELEYKKKGYLTSIVYIPEQEIRDGAVELRIAEGRMGYLNIENNKWFSTDFIKKFIHLKKNEILNIRTLARDILRLNKNSDLDIKAVISTGKEPQTSDIYLKVDDKFPWHIGFLEDNRGSRLSGKYRSMWTIRSSNVSGLGDNIFLSTIYSGKSFGESVSYSIPVGTYGTKLGVNATYFWSKLGKELKPFKITGNTQIYSPYLAWELELSESSETYANLGIDIKSVINNVGSTTSSNDQLRIPYIGFDVSKIDMTGQSSFSPRFSFGTARFLGAYSRDYSKLSRPNSGGFFFKYEHSLNRLQKMFLESYMTIRSRFQTATHTLAPTEQFQLGGADSVRGYPEGDYLADTGAVVNFDWVFPTYFIPNDLKLPGQDTPLRNQIQPVFFVDIGGGGLSKAFSGEKKSKFLAGVGGGLLLHFKHLSMRLYWAGSVGDKPTPGAGPSTFYFTFQSEM